MERWDCDDNNTTHDGLKDAVTDRTNESEHYESVQYKCLDRKQRLLSAQLQMQVSTCPFREDLEG